MLWPVIIFIPSVIITALSATFVLLYFYSKRNFTYWKERAILEAWQPRVFLGNFGRCFFMQQSVEKFMRELYRSSENEKLIGYYVLNKPHLMIRDPDLIKQVLVKDFQNFPDRYSTTGNHDVLGNNNLLLIKEPNWRPLRQMTSKFFTSGKMRENFGKMLKVADDLDVYLKTAGLEDGEGVVETAELCYKFATDLIGIMIHGIEMNSLNSPKAEFRRQGKYIFRSTHLRHFDFLCTFFFPQYAQVVGAKFFDNGPSEFINEAFQEILNTKIISQYSRADFFDLIVTMKHDKLRFNPLKRAFTDMDLISQAAIFLTAGFGTTAATMMFCLLELAKYPDVQDKLRNEIRKALKENDDRMTYDLIGSLAYLDAVVWEALRIYPAMVSLDRVSTTKYTFPGTTLTIDKGTPISIPLRALQMDEKYFTDPKCFNPDRFYGPEKKSQILKYTFFPFGDGPRMCIGMRLGLLVVKFGLCHIVSKYSIELCAKTNLNVGYHTRSLFLAPSSDIMLRMKTIK